MAFDASYMMDATSSSWGFRSEAKYEWHSNKSTFTNKYAGGGFDLPNNQ